MKHVYQIFYIYILNASHPDCSPLDLPQFFWVTPLKGCNCFLPPLFCIPCSWPHFMLNNHKVVPKIYENALVMIPLLIVCLLPHVWMIDMLIIS